MFYKPASPPLMLVPTPVSVGPGSVSCGVAGDTVGSALNTMGMSTMVWLGGTALSEAKNSSSTVMPGPRSALMVTSKVHPIWLDPGGNGQTDVTGLRCEPSATAGSVYVQVSAVIWPGGWSTAVTSP